MNRNDVAGSVVAILAGGLLIVAAVLKLNQQVDPSWFIETSVPGFWMNLAGLFFDFFLAAAILSGFRRNLVFVVSGVVFAIYAYLNLYFHYVDQDCGCFGKWTPEPIQMMAIDGALAVLLFACCWKCGKFTAGTRTQGLATACSLAALVAFSALYLQANNPGNLLADDTGFGHHNSESGEIRLLDPSKWVGGPFKLTESTVPAIEEESATFFIVSKGCAKCEKLIDQIVLRKKTSHSNEKIVIVNIDGPIHNPGFGIVTSHLDLSKRWYCKTPTAIEVENGTVRNVKDVTSAL